MILEFIPVAEASLETLMKSVNRVIINPVIYFLFALALVYFLYGVAQYLLQPENEDVRKTSKSHMFYGVIGLFVMVAVFGIMQVIMNTLGVKNIKVERTGDYSINNGNKNFILDGESEADLDKYNPTEFDINIDTGEEISKVKNLNKFTNEKGEYISPFVMEYIKNPLCWREELYFKTTTEYAAIAGVKGEARKKYLLDNGPATPENSAYPINFGILTTYDSENKVYIAWVDARAPIGKGTPNDCVLPASSKKEFTLKDYVDGEPFSSPRYASDGSSIFTNHYLSDSLFIRIVASGVDNALQLAREFAIKNAFAKLGIEIQDINRMTIVYPTARILEEKYITNPITGKYEYWVAVESKKLSNVVYGSTEKSPFTKVYEDNSLFGVIVNFASSKNPTTARELAIKNATIELSKKVDPKDLSKGALLVFISDEKQIYNEKTGNYDYWVVVEGSKSLIGSKPEKESSRVIPFTKIYTTNNVSYQVVASGVDKDSSIARGLALNNAIIKLQNNIGVTMTGSRAVKILEEKQLFNSITGNYEYWVALEVSK